MACLDENTLAAYLGRGLSEAETDRVDAHLAVCSACRALVLDVADGDEALATTMPAIAPARDDDDEEAPLPRGAVVGRYVLLRVLGRGGFGVVYAAHDPTLDRTIALKLLRPDAVADPDATHRFVREAQAMARVSHPHVVTVHDAGEVDGRVFIAMELFDGRDLKLWLRAEPRPWRAKVEVFVEAARGLAAAHEAGIVHRDFKPANVLVRKDGRVAVTDFGLAREAAPAAGVAASGGATTMAGTPAYMAPEQLRGEPATKASDQFAFAVALYESLAGEHPFEGNDVKERVAAVVQGRRRQPALGSVPRRIRRAIERGLSARPEDRFASIAEMSRALAPRRRPAGLALALGAALFGSLAIVGTLGVERATVCRGAAREMGLLWNDGVRADVTRRFAATGAAHAEESSRAFAQKVDRYTERWSALSTEACEATRLRKAQSEAALDARSGCLERARIQLRTLIEEARQANAANLASITEAAVGLRDLGECEDSVSLLAQVQPPKESRARVDELRARLAEARARRGAGQLARADGLVEDAYERARALDYAPLMAEALIEAGIGSAMHGDFDRSELFLDDALRAAARGRHDRAAAEAWVELVYVAGVLRGAPAKGRLLYVGARSALDRIGGSASLGARLASSSGLIHASEGELDEALRDHREAVRLFAEAGSAEAPELGPELARVAEVLAELAQWDAAAEEASRAKARIAASFGEHHATMALPLTVLARRACARGDARECGRLADEAIAVRSTPSMKQRPNDPTFLPMLVVHARAMWMARRYDDAVADLSRAREMIDAYLGPKDAWKGIVGAEIAEALTAKGEGATAVETSRAAVAILEGARGAQHPDTALARVGLGAALVAAGRPREATVEIDHGLEALTARFGAASPILVGPLVAKARALRASGAPAEDVRRLAERAVRTGATGETLDLAAARELLR